MMRFMKSLRLILLFAALVCFAETGSAQEFVVFGGGGITNLGDAVHGSVHFGADFESPADLRNIRKMPYPGFLLEGGYIGPFNRFSAGSAIFSANPAWELPFSATRRSVLFTIGYTRMFATGNALNYGAGLSLPVGHGANRLRIEVRDYMRFTSATEHNFALRLGYALYASD
jgi:hypothetical protein